MGCVRHRMKTLRLISKVPDAVGHPLAHAEYMVCPEIMHDV